MNPGNPSITIADFRLYTSGSLRGYIKTCIAGAYIIDGFRLMETNGRKWIAAPSREFKKKDGSTGYAETFQFTSPQVKREFERALLEQIEAIPNETK